MTFGLVNAPVKLEFVELAEIDPIYLELVRREAEGETIEAPAPEEAPGKVVSLADALSASLAAARTRSAPRGGARPHRPAAAARTARKPGRKRRA